MASIIYSGLPQEAPGMLRSLTQRTRRHDREAACAQRSRALARHASGWRRNRGDAALVPRDFIPGILCRAHVLFSSSFSRARSPPSCCHSARSSAARDANCGTSPPDAPALSKSSMLTCVIAAAALRLTRCPRSWTKKKCHTAVVLFATPDESKARHRVTATTHSKQLDIILAGAAGGEARVQ